MTAQVGGRISTAKESGSPLTLEIQDAVDLSQISRVEVRSTILAEQGTGSLWLLSQTATQDGREQTYAHSIHLGGDNREACAILDELATQEQITLNLTDQSGACRSTILPNPGALDFDYFRRLLRSRLFRPRQEEVCARTTADLWSLAGQPWLLGEHNPFAPGFAAADNTSKRNDLCPCGSGVKFKRCHDQAGDSFMRKKQLSLEDAPIDPPLWVRQQWSHKRIPFKTYRCAMPSELAPWHLYTEEHGHCVAVRIRDANRPDLTHISTIPVRSVLRIPYEVPCGWIELQLRPMDKKMLQSHLPVDIEH